MSIIDQIPVANQDVIGKFIDGELLLIHPNHGKVRVVNTVGGRIWELINGVRTIKDIIIQLVSEYQVEYEQAEKDTLAFLISMREIGLISLNP